MLLSFSSGEIDHCGHMYNEKHIVGYSSLSASIVVVVVTIVIVCYCLCRCKYACRWLCNANYRL